MNFVVTLGEIMQIVKSSIDDAQCYQLACLSLEGAMLKLITTTALIVSAFLFTQESLAQSFSSLPNFPQCFDKQGKRAKLVLTTSSEIQNAASFYDGSLPMIALNTEFMSNFSSLMQIFIYMHECGHLQLNHPNPFSKRPAGESFESQSHEIEADCWALKNLNKMYPLTRENVEHIILQQYLWIQLLEVPELKTQLIHPGTSHPAGYIRSEALKRCPIR